MRPMASRRSAANSARTSSPLPRIEIAPPGCAFSAATSDATSRTTVAGCHGSGSRRVRDATYLGSAFNVFANGSESGWFGQ